MSKNTGGFVSLILELYTLKNQLPTDSFYAFWPQFEGKHFIFGAKANFLLK